MQSPKQTLTLMQLSLLFFILSASLVLLPSCGKIKIPVAIQDITLYFIKGAPLDQNSYSNYALEEHFLDSTEADLTMAQYNPIAAGNVCTTLAFWADINTWTAKLCSEAPCSFEVTQQLAKLNAMVQRMQTANRKLALK